MTKHISTEPKATTKQGIIIVLASSLTIMGSVMIAAMIPKMIAEFAAITPNFNHLLPLAIAGPALAIAVFSPCVGWFIDRFGRKNVLIIATFLYALLGSVPAVLSDFSQIVVSRLLFGLAEAVIMVACSTLIADYWKDEARAKFVNFQVVAIGLVGAIFFVLGGVLGEHHWKTPFYLYLLPLLLIPFMVKYLWEPNCQATINQVTAMTVGSVQKSNIKVLILNYILIIFCMILAFIVPIQTPLLLADLSIQSTTLIGMSAGLGLLASLAGALIWPVLRQRFNTRGVNIILLACAAMGLYLLIHAQNYTQVLLAVFVHGIGVGMMVPNTMLPVMNAVTDINRGKALGGFTSSLYLGQFLSPILIEIMMVKAHHLQDAIWQFVVLAFMICLIFIFSIFLKKPTVPVR